MKPLIKIIQDIVNNEISKLTSGSEKKLTVRQKFVPQYDPNILSNIISSTSSANQSSPLVGNEAAFAKVEPAPPQIIDGLDVYAMTPPSFEVKVTDGTVYFNNSYRTVSGIIIDLTQYKNPQETTVLYVIYNGETLKPSRTVNKQKDVICGKVIVFPESICIQDDYSPHSLDGYIVNHTDPYFDNSYRVDDDSVAAFKNTLEKIFAENILGTITLSEALKILSADGKLEITADGMKIYNKYNNILAEYGKNFIRFFNNNGECIAVFSPETSQIGTINIDNPLKSSIYDTNGIERVALGMLGTINDRAIWGLNVKDGNGKNAISITDRNVWFLGGVVSPREQSIPSQAILLNTNRNIDNELDASPWQTGGIASINFGTEYKAKGPNLMIFDGDNIWILAKKTSTGKACLIRINPTFPPGEYNLSDINDYIGIFDLPLDDNETVYRRSICYAKNRVFVCFGHLISQEVRYSYFYAIPTNALSSAEVKHVYTDSSLLHLYIFYDGKYIYTTSFTPYHLHKWEITTDGNIGLKLTTTPQAMYYTAITGDGKNLYITRNDSISIIDPASLAIKEEVAVSGGYLLDAYNLFYDGKWIVSKKDSGSTTYRFPAFMSSPDVTIIDGFPPTRMAFVDPYYVSATGGTSRFLQLYHSTAMRIDTDYPLSPVIPPYSLNSVPVFDGRSIWVYSFDTTGLLIARTSAPT